MTEHVSGEWLVISPHHLQGKIGKKTVIENVEDDVDELPDSDFSKAAAIIFDKIDHGKDGALPSSKFVDLIETLGGGLHSEEMAGHMQKVDPNTVN